MWRRGHGHAPDAGGGRGGCECAGDPAAAPVYDSASGDLVCTGCGVVVEAYHAVDTKEWFEDRDARADAPSIVPHLKTDSQTNAYRTLMDGLACLKLPRTHRVALTAVEILLKVMDRSTVRRDVQAGVTAACAYAAFKVEGETRDVGVVARAFAVAVVDISRVMERVTDALEGTPLAARLVTARVHPRNLVPDFASRLEIPTPRRKTIAARALAKGAALGDEAHQMGREPRTICAALIAEAAAELGVALPPGAVERACGVCAQVLNVARKELVRVRPPRP